MHARHDPLALLHRDPLFGRVATFGILCPISCGYLLYDLLNLSKMRQQPWLVLH